MKQTLAILTFFLLSHSIYGQTSYIGYIDNDPIKLITRIYTDNDINAFYVYAKINEPIHIKGTLKNGVLTLIEKDNSGKPKATLLFKDFKTENNHIEGVWKENNSNKERKITLTKSFDINYGDSIEWRDKELLQDTSLKDKYFTIVVSKKKGDFYPGVTGVKIFEKKTDKLLQQFSLDCDLLGFSNVFIDDYNFDGYIDFSVFERSYTGPNTTSIYFLYNPRTGKYFKSSFGGVSLDFDPKAKRIYEHNECCMGRSIINAEYKVRNNKMILIDKTCLKYDEITKEFKKVKCE